VIRDDAQVAELHATKGYGERPGLAVVLRSLEAKEVSEDAPLYRGPSWRETR